jgi:hypothetical protein
MHEMILCCSMHGCVRAWVRDCVQAQRSGTVAR